METHDFSGTCDVFSISLRKKKIKRNFSLQDIISSKSNRNSGCTIFLAVCFANSFFLLGSEISKPKLFTASASWPLQVIMAFSFSSLFSELSPSGESRKMRKKWPHNHANQIRTWCLKGKILNCEMIHKKVEVSETLKREKKNKNLCVLHFFQELDIFFVKMVFNFYDKGKMWGLHIYLWN